MFSLRIPFLLALATLFLTAQAQQYGFGVRVDLDTTKPGCDPINSIQERRIQEMADWALYKAREEQAVGFTYLPTTDAGSMNQFYTDSNGVTSVQETDGTWAELTTNVRKLASSAESERRLCVNAFCSFFCNSQGTYCFCCDPQCGYGDCGIRRRQLRVLEVVANTEVKLVAERVHDIIVQSIQDEPANKLKCVKRDPVTVDVIFQKV